MGSDCAIILSGVVLVAILANILFCMHLVLILPYYMTQDGYVAPSQKNLNDLHAACHCERPDKVPPYTNSGDQITQSAPGSNDPVSSPNPSDKIRKPRSPPLLAKFPMLLSLSIRAFSDSQEVILACIGVIISENWGLAHEGCVSDSSEWFEITVRSGSNFWSKLGYQHSIKTFIPTPLNGLVAIKISPPFQLQQGLVEVTRFEEFAENWTVAEIPKWNDQLYKKDLQHRFNHKPVEGDKFFQSDCFFLDIKEFSSHDLQNFWRVTSEPVLGTSGKGCIGFRMKDGLGGKMFLKINQSILKNYFDRIQSENIYYTSAQKSFNGKEKILELYQCKI